jgi:hypothetical protein
VSTVGQVGGAAGSQIELGNFRLFIGRANRLEAFQRCIVIQLTAEVEQRFRRNIFSSAELKIRGNEFSKQITTFK